MNKTEETVNMNKSPYISDTETLYLALKSGIEELIKNFRVWYDHGSIEMIDVSELVLKYQCLPDIPSLLDITLPVERYESGRSVISFTADKNIKQEYFQEVLTLSGDHVVHFNLIFGNVELYNSIIASYFPTFNTFIRNMIFFPYIATSMKSTDLKYLYSNGGKSMKKFDKFLKNLEMISNRSLHELALEYRDKFSSLNESFRALKAYNLPVYCEYTESFQYLNVKWCVINSKKVLYPVLVDHSKKLQYSMRGDQRGIAWCWIFGMKIQTFSKY